VSIQASSGGGRLALLKEAVEEEEEGDDDDGAARVSLTMALTGFQREKCERASEREREKGGRLGCSTLLCSHLTRRFGKRSSGGHIAMWQ
jgi:hypothetical protein